jgi:hypothetical protein
MLEITSNPLLTELSGMQALATVNGDLFLASNDLGALVLPKLRKIGGQFLVGGLSRDLTSEQSLGEISLPLLTEIGANLATRPYPIPYKGPEALTIDGTDALTTLSMPLLATIYGRIAIRSNALLDDPDLHSLSLVNAVLTDEYEEIAIFDSNPKLTTLARFGAAMVMHDSRKQYDWAFRNNTLLCSLSEIEDRLVDYYTFPESGNCP